MSIEAQERSSRIVTLPRRVETGPLETALLSSIEGLLTDTLELVKLQVPTGFYDAYKFTVDKGMPQGATVNFVDLFGRPLFSVSIRNDGPANLWIGVNREADAKEYKAPIPSGDKLDINLPAAKLSWLNFKSDGSATIRLYMSG